MHGGLCLKALILFYILNVRKYIWYFFRRELSATYVGSWLNEKNALLLYKSQNV